MGQLHYDTVSEAVAALQKQGFTTDFRLEQDRLVCPVASFGADEFTIVDIYRYEGDTDPADEASVYAIKSRSGLKGILVTGYGASADAVSTALLEKLHSR
ncbi:MULTISPECIES: hypothetical protein [Spirosoma]|uniref:Phosphoribosylpyrophosphate synthetase n=1 Tax=Spirosoma sordidisoli TaxID=2502893 RepID=A0A4Q2URX4_9BACT|nr:MULTISPECIES: hypothetical protein [Spirosoma]RYC71792.1 hypothetical protein EQG79_06600 [Spirosoma sordidisoli]